MGTKSKKAAPRIVLQGATPEQIDLLYHVGIKQVKQLADIRSQELQQRLKIAKHEVNFSVGVRLPSQKTIEKWKSQARCELPGGIIVKPKP